MLAVWRATRTTPLHTGAQTWVTQIERVNAPDERDFQRLGRNTPRSSDIDVEDKWLSVAALSMLYPRKDIRDRLKHEVGVLVLVQGLKRVCNLHGSIGVDWRRRGYIGHDAT